MSGARNVLVLCIDDLNDWTGYLGGYPGVQTPDMDALAAESTAYQRAYCSAPACLPSRASVIWNRRPDATGLDAQDAAVRDGATYASLVSDIETSLPGQMAALGYETISAGKVTHEVEAQLWDVVGPTAAIRDLRDETSAAYRSSGYDYGPIPDDRPHPDQLVADWASDLLVQGRGQPFLCMIGMSQPHVPWRLPAWNFEQYPLDDVVVPTSPPGDLDDVPPAGLELIGPSPGTPDVTDERIEASGRRAEVVRAYLAATTHTDAMVGQILDALARSRHADDTTVVLWSDHGFHLGEKLHWGKRTVWERATRVPFLIRDPDLKAGDIEAPVSLLDLAPTVLDLAGGTPPPSWDGRSLVDFDESQAADRPALMFWEGHRSIRSEQWRYTRYADGGEELYALDADPDELTNLADEAAHADTVARLAGQLPA